MYKHEINSNDRNYLILVGGILLFIITFFFKSFSISDVSIDHQVKKLEQQLHRQEQDAVKLLADSNLISKLTNKNETIADLNELHTKPYFLYVYKNYADSQYLRFWSTDLVMLPDSVLDNSKAEQFVHLQNGYYYVHRLKDKKDVSLSIYFVVLVKSDFFVSDNHFVQSFPLNRALDGIAVVSDKATSLELKSLSGKERIYLKQKPNTSIGSTSVFTILVRLLGFFLIFVALYFLLNRKFSGRNAWQRVFLLISLLMVVRLFLYVFKHLLGLDNTALFDPQVYASNALLPSLGDLLINSLLFWWLAVYLWKKIQIFEKFKSAFQIQRINLTQGVLAILMLLALSFTCINIINGLISNSKISFDVTNFFSLSVFTFIGLMIIVFIGVGFLNSARILFWFLFRAFGKKKHWIYVLMSLLGLIYITIFVSHAEARFNILYLLWVLAFTFLFNHEYWLNKFIRFNIPSVVLWVILFSLSISALLFTEINKAELRQRKVFIEKLNTQTDPSTERLINIAHAFLDSNFFRNNFYRFYAEPENRYLRDSILSNNYARYLKTFTGRLYLYDSLNKPLFNTDSLSYESVNTIVSRLSKPTDQPDLFFYETAYDKFAYITYREVKDLLGKKIGTVGIVSQPKQFSNVSMSPQLFRQYKDWEFTNSVVYNYAIYANRLLVSSSKKYPFTSTIEEFEVPRYRFELREQEGYSELWYRPGKNKVIVMTRKNERWTQFTSLFSYLFCAFLFMMALIQLSSGLLSVVLKASLFSRRMKLVSSIRSQIHSTFILITVLSFIVIGVATISFFTKSFNDANKERLGRTMDIMLNEMQSQKELTTLIYEQRSHQDSTRTIELQSILKRVADIHGLDVNVYDYSGMLIGTSQPFLYENGFLSPLMDPRAYYYLSQLRHIQHAQTEQVSNLQFTSMYAPMRNSSGAFSAYLSIPYFTSQQELSDEISKFLITLINLNAFIFLITGLVAYLIANYITRSFAVIKDKMMHVNLSRHNEMISWEKNDEIGGLVAEYNKMVAKLQESAAMLAKSERLEAWREMARQVAHEIKNPLTPMKLSLQYLQRAVDNNQSNVVLLAANVSKTLVEQIDHLSKIAANFSQFADINKGKKEIFDLHEMLQSLVAIHNSNPMLVLLWLPVSEPIFVLADKTQMNRMFTNLFANAIEARREDTPCKLIIQERLQTGKILISFRDNGTGITDEMKEKIFMPNFTTKSSGTGLGLAMCKGIVEGAGGEIYFDSILHEGSTFHVLLPLVD